MTLATSSKLELTLGADSDASQSLTLSKSSLEGKIKMVVSVCNFYPFIKKPLLQKTWIMSSSIIGNFF